MLRNSALKIIRALGIEGGCNVQFSLEEETYARGSHHTLDTESGSPTEDEKPAATDVKTFSGTAVLNESMKITSLVLRK